MSKRSAKDAISQPRVGDHWSRDFMCEQFYVEEVDVSAGTMKIRKALHHEHKTFGEAPLVEVDQRYFSWMTTRLFHGNHLEVKG